VPGAVLEQAASKPKGQVNELSSSFYNKNLKRRVLQKTTNMAALALQQPPPPSPHAPAGAPQITILTSPAGDGSGEFARWF
jgi:hypothetical protein